MKKIIFLKMCRRKTYLREEGEEKRSRKYPLAAGVKLSWRENS
jgi:hypothetical protein